MKYQPGNDTPAGKFMARFLLVDDDSEHLELLERCVSTMGFDFVSAADGKQALKILGTGHFDIVVSDIQMPDISGMDLLKAVKKTHPETDVILLTGYSNNYTFTDVIREGATDYLEKPFVRDAIHAKIIRVLQERSLLAGYKQEIVQRRDLEKNLQEKSDALEKRVGELNCLYHVSRIVEQKKDKPAEIFQSTINIVSSGFQHPDLAVARIKYGADEYCTAGFQQTPWSLKAEIKLKEAKVGLLEVCYLRETAGTCMDTFLTEEQWLLNEIAEKMGRVLDRQSAKDELFSYFHNLEEAVRLRTQELHATQASIEAVFHCIPDGILSVNSDKVVTHVNGKCTQILNVEVGKVFPSGETKFQNECLAVLVKTMDSGEAVTDYRIENIKEGLAFQVVLLSTSLLLDALNRKPGALLIIHDITRLEDLEKQLLERRRFRQIIGRSARMQEIYSNVRKLASVDTTVLVTGESGTGKELLIETLHSSGNRAAKPLIKVNCAALPENLLESELFGHIRGSFTGALQDRVGRIQAAEGGIIFLDEIGDVSARIQLKLLRFLEAKEYERVGESQTRKADVRVFAATNADLARKVREGVFREDLYYRLKVMVIHLPPLRERRDDIPILTDHFLGIFNIRFNKAIASISREVYDIFLGHDWPGNIRELKHVLEHAVLLSSGHELLPENLPKDLVAIDRQPSLEGQPSRSLTRDLLRNALQQVGGNKAKAARILKLSRATLYSKMKEFNL